jgi:glycosyltransferase involved in cell wall biosynthesis
VRITYLHPKLDFTDSTARMLASVRVSLGEDHEVTVISRKGSRALALRATGATFIEGELPTHRLLGIFAASRTSEQVAELHPDLLHFTDVSLAPLAMKIADDLQCPYILEACRPIEAPLVLSATNSRAVLLPADTFIEKAVNKGNVPRPLLQVIEHGPDLTSEWQQRLPMESRRPVIIGLGTLDSAHGFDVLIDAAKLLARAGRKLDWLVLGEGPDEDQLRRKVRELELCEHFTINSPNLGDIHLALAQADLHICSVRSGVPGWSAVRALGMGIPSVFSAISSTFPLIEDRQEGLLVGPGDSTKLVQSINVLLDNPQAARQMAVSARNKMHALKLHETFRRELIELHNQAMGLVVN